MKVKREFSTGSNMKTFVFVVKIDFFLQVILTYFLAIYFSKKHEDLYLGDQFYLKNNFFDKFFNLFKIVL